MNVEVAVLGSPSLIVFMVSVDVKQQWAWMNRAELRGRMNVEVAVLGSPSLIVFMVSVDVKQQWTNLNEQGRAQGPYECRGGRPGLPVPNSLYGLCRCKATVNEPRIQSSGAVWMSRWPSWAPVPNSHYGLSGCKATLNEPRIQSSGAVWMSRWPSWGSPSLIVIMVSLDVKQHWTNPEYGVLELCECRGGRPGLPVPNSHYGLSGCKATLNEPRIQRSGAVWMSRWPSWAPRP